MSTKNKIALLITISCIFCMSVVTSVTVFAQKPDSSITSIRAKRINKTPQIKVTVPTYRPNRFGFIPYNDIISSARAGTTSAPKPEKLLYVLKVYPNPVDDQINIILRVERESNFSVKIMDLLGNEVVTLSNERIPSGEQIKNYTIPSRLNAGIYFLKIVAGTETVVKRISVL